MNSHKKQINVTRSSIPTYEEYIEAIKPLWETRWLTNMGVYHKQLEERLTQYLEVLYVSLMVNGHMALELTIQSFDFPEWGEVITTPFTFISTTHAIIRNKLTPVFCDVKMDGTIDESLIEGLITDRTVAILPVHVYGTVCSVEAIDAIAKKHNLKVIYDAAHAFGVKYGGKGIGNYGDASVFSFHATKVFNTIEGGAVTFSDPNLYERLYNLKNFGIRDEETVVSVGANAKMNELCAIMGLCNLKHIEKSIADRGRVINCYLEQLSEVKGIRFLKHRDKGDNNGYFPVLIEDEYAISRDELYKLFRKENIGVRKYFYPLTSDQECFGENFCNSSVLNARYLANRILTLPVYEGMEDEDIMRVLKVIKDAGK